MKQRLRRYFLAMLTVLFVIGIVLLCSDVGYVYIYLWQWQIQSSLLILLLLWAIFSLSVYFVAQIIKKLQRKHLQKQQQITHFQQFYRYEQTGILYLLQTQYRYCEHQFKIMRETYHPSLFLKPLIKAHIAYQHQHYDKAFRHLKWVVPSCFELKELQLIQIYLAQHDAQKSLTHLLVLEHTQQAWLQDIDDLYQKKLHYLWVEFAILFPIVYVQQQRKHTFSAEQWQSFCQALLNKINHVEQLPITIADLDIFNDVQQQYRQSTACIWYKILYHLDLHQAEQYFQSIMQQYFDEDLFHLWLYQRLQDCDTPQIEKQLAQWQARYTHLPCFQFAQILCDIQQGNNERVQQYLNQVSEHQGIQRLQQLKNVIHELQWQQIWAIFYYQVDEL
ncbi:hypothetical protein [Moraxella sp. ZY210820]|uniref:hypothetical protein n=1 Tax=unclassified Moraxella TaxID=2685852 RepID=UPI00273209DA|nr:hypothetical protein [Moraxella sp. ZY210820]WLF83647.1 hypothetical protein LU301_10385 [Moraxella sp. ZY210820]